MFFQMIVNHIFSKLKKLASFRISRKNGYENQNFPFMAFFGAENMLQFSPKTVSHTDLFYFETALSRRIHLYTRGTALSELIYL